jgi:type IV secretion system protein VirB10
MVIADAGDRLTGEQTVEMGQGQVSVFTTWNELEPNPACVLA